MRVTLGGAEVDLVDEADASRLLLGRLGMEHGRPLFVASANLDHIYHFGLDSGREGAFAPGRGGADWLVLLDGRPLVWTARRLTGRAWPQLAGSDLLPDLLSTAVRARASVGFLGGTPSMHRKLETVLAVTHPNLTVAGTWAPPRETVEDPAASARLADEIRASGVDLLVVGLGKPRQELWLLRHGADTGARAAVAFGAAADFLAGTAVRAPVYWRHAGLEWLYRLVREPLRLARRYLVQGPSAAYRLFTQSRTEELAAVGRARPGPPISSPAGWRRRVGKLLVAMDALAIGLASLLAYLGRRLLGDLGITVELADIVPVAAGVLPIWLAIFAVFGCYRPQYLSAGGEAARRFLAASFGGLLALGFVSFALNLNLARGYVAILFVLVLLFGGLARFGVRRYLRNHRARGRFVQNVLVVGAGPDGVEVAAAMAGADVSGYRVVGFLDDTLAPGDVVEGLRVLGRPEDVLDVAYDVRAGLVVVTPTGVGPGTLEHVTVALEGSAIDLAVAPSLFEVMTHRVSVEPVGNVPLLHVEQVRLERGKAAAKRVLDIVVAAALIVLLSPAMLAAAVAVRVREGRPVLYRQERVGRDGERFTILKFRTMVRDADERLVEVAGLNEAGHHFFKIREDPRVTRTGRFLRKWSIDETPQLLNVLKGEMSLVGPRPPIPAEVEKYEPWHHRRLRVRPGITGVWQTSGRSKVPFDEAVRMDIFYIENWSLGYDLVLLAKTVAAVLGRWGAY